MIIKMVNEFKLTVVHFAHPNPMQICACMWNLPLDKNTVENKDQATGPWAAGLLLAKPHQNSLLSFIEPQLCMS